MYSCLNFLSVSQIWPSLEMSSSLTKTSCSCMPPTVRTRLPLTISTMSSQPSLRRCGPSCETGWSYLTISSCQSRESPNILSFSTTSTSQGANAYQHNAQTWSIFFFFFWTCKGDQNPKFSAKHNYLTICMKIRKFKCCLIPTLVQHFDA